MIITLNFQFKKEEAWKNQGVNGIRTGRDLRDTGAMLYQLSYRYEATHVCIAPV